MVNILEPRRQNLSDLCSRRAGVFGDPKLVHEGCRLPIVVRVDALNVGIRFVLGVGRPLITRSAAGARGIVAVVVMFAFALVALLALASRLRSFASLRPLSSVSLSTCGGGDPLLRSPKSSGATSRTAAHTTSAKDMSPTGASGPRRDGLTAPTLAASRASTTMTRERKSTATRLCDLTHPTHSIRSEAD